MTEQRPLDVALENRLMGKGIYLSEWAHEDETVTLEYETVAAPSSVTSHEVGTVVRTLLECADERDTWSPVTLEATSLTTDGEVRGTWRVEADWFRRLGDDLTEVEFSRRVLESVEDET
ncbi:hypothetical protein [Natrialbaceae archaeon AArc-T1-2]|uniref:hypothetical protein n=1 Tax=Natrialbaceae archaeon AArc-T1-2 TaxID=3053904 RepID=UPI00255AD335|nr:hypothetical protein [Natrialbaceae archaeon AArc-T1-2]WIV67512.1 hypothetical protein QQ977_01930 [Natrialbaceae archaeon AArc-T1-2]